MILATESAKQINPEPVEGRRSLEAARRKRLAEAHVLAAAMYRWMAENDPGGAKALLALPNFQRHVILREAKNLSFEAESRRDLTAQQLGEICSSLRRWMQQHGIEEPESRRDRQAKKQGGIETSQWRQLTLLIDRVERELTWSRAHLRNWMRSSLNIRSARPRTQEEAKRLIRGLEGVLRHAKKESRP